MDSKQKSKALILRKKGLSLKTICKKLNVAPSTISGWIKGIELTKAQKRKLKADWRNGLAKARKLAVVWHNTQKTKRLEKAKEEANNVLSHINLNDKNVLELALAFLYLGEGSKKNNLSLGNSNADILLFYLHAIEKLYGLKREFLRYDLHLRADQKPEELKKYWSKILSIPIEAIKYCAIDKRTTGRETHENYKGVCIVTYYNLALQRRLVEISKMYSSMSIQRAVSSAGRAFD